MIETPNYSKLETEFVKIENSLKESISSLEPNSQWDCNIKTLVDNLHKMTKRALGQTSVNLTSFAMLIDDFYLISFPKRKKSDRYVWDTFAYHKNGLISDSIESAITNNLNVISYPTKQALLKNPHISQRKDFEKSKVMSYFVCPILFKDTIIGCIILSLKVELKEQNEVDLVEEYLKWLKLKILWIVYSEYLRVNSVIEKCRFLVNALSTVDEYQSYHSDTVSKLAVLFACCINKSKYLRKVICRDFKSFVGADFLLLKIAGLCHDVGKISMEEFEDPRNEIQYRERQLHSFISYRLLDKCKMPHSIVAIAGNHHEGVRNSGEPCAVDLENQPFSVETQIIKFVDIVDSSIRERGPHQGLEATEVRQSIKVAIGAVNYNKDMFSENVFKALIGILKGFDDESKSKRKNQYFERYKPFFNEAIESLGVHASVKDTNNKTMCFEADCENASLKKQILLKDQEICEQIKSLKRNNWAIMFAFKKVKSGDPELMYFENSPIKKNSKEKNKTISIPIEIREKTYVVHLMLKSDKYVRGVYVDNGKKRGYAYSFCQSLADYLGDKNGHLVCAFFSYRMSRSKDIDEIIRKCKTKLISVCKENHTHWRLLKYSSEIKDWE